MPPRFPLTLPCPFSPLPRSLSPRPNAAVTAVRHSRSHRPGLAPPTCPQAPRHLPRPLRQAWQLRAPRIVVIAVVFFTTGRRGSPPPARRRPAVPEPASTPSATAVRCRSSSPSPFSPSHTTAASPLEAVPRPPPRALLRRAPAPPQPPTSSPGCGRRRATPRWSPPDQPPLVAQVRQVAAALLVVAGQNSDRLTWPLVRH